MTEIDLDKVLAQRRELKQVLLETIEHLFDDLNVPQDARSKILHDGPRYRQLIDTPVSDVYFVEAMEELVNMIGNRTFEGEDLIRSDEKCIQLIENLWNTTLRGLEMSPGDKITIKDAVDRIVKLNVEKSAWLKFVREHSDVLDEVDKKMDPLRRLVESLKEDMQTFVRVPPRTASIIEL